MQPGLTMARSAEPAPQPSSGADHPGFASIRRGFDAQIANDLALSGEAAAARVQDDAVPLPVAGRTGDPLSAAADRTPDHTLEAVATAPLTDGRRAAGDRTSPLPSVAVWPTGPRVSLGAVLLVSAGLCAPLLLLRKPAAPLPTGSSATAGVPAAVASHAPPASSVDALPPRAAAAASVPVAAASGPQEPACTAAVRAMSLCPRPDPSAPAPKP
jgi:hypothetical protein